MPKNGPYKTTLNFLFSFRVSSQFFIERMKVCFKLLRTIMDYRQMVRLERMKSLLLVVNAL